MSRTVFDGLPAARLRAIMYALAITVTTALMASLAERGQVPGRLRLTVSESGVLRPPVRAWRGARQDSTYRERGETTCQGLDAPEDSVSESPRGGQLEYAQAAGPAGGAAWMWSCQYRCEG